MAYAINSGKWIIPIVVLKTNIFVFKKCMQVTNGALTLSYVATGAICILKVVLGQQQSEAIVLCQTLILFTKKV